LRSADARDLAASNATSAIRGALTVPRLRTLWIRAASLKLANRTLRDRDDAAKPEGLQRSLFDLNRSNRSGTIFRDRSSDLDDIEELLDEYPQSY